MCGRFARAELMAFYAGYCDANPAPEDFPSWNIAPGDDILAVLAEPDQSRHLAWLHWGLVPSWSKGPDRRFSMINARAETLAEKPAYRAAFRHRRCLILADGFYEWRNTPEGKQPYYVRLASGEPMALAGLWENWEAKDGSESIHSAAIITTRANPAMAPIHDRMPVIIPKQDFGRWLDPKQTDPGAVQDLLEPIGADRLELWRVSTRVNSPTHQGEELTRSIEEPQLL